MKRPRIVWTDAPPKDEASARPRRELRPRVRFALAGAALFTELGAIYFLLDSIGGDLLAVPALVTVGTVSPVRNRMIRAAERLARKVLPDHSPENAEGVSS